MISHVDTSEVEKRLREKCDAIVLKQNVSGKSDVWKNFSVIFEKQRRGEESDDLTSVETLVELKYRVMSTTARRLYCINASSAQSERDFSSVGRAVTDMRSRLSKNTVEAIELLRWGMRAGLLSNQ